MGTGLQWIKDAVGLCINGLNDEEIRLQFKNLEQRYLELRFEEKIIIRNAMNQFELNDRIYILSCFIQYMNVDDFKEAVLENIIQGSFSYCAGSMLEFQIMILIENYYQKKRMLHKKNMDSIKELLGLAYPYIPVKERKQNRIAIITEQMMSLLHAPTKVVLDFAYIMKQRLGYEIMIFACPCDAVLPEDLWHSGGGARSLDIFADRPMRIDYKDAVFEGYQINMHSAGYLKEYAMMLSIIYNWNPLFVFAMGAVNPVADLPGEFTTVASMRMAIDCPVSEGEILIRVQKKDEETEREYAAAMGENQTQVFIEDEYPVVVEKGKRLYNRSELGLPENKFIIAIVGNRLELEINQKFAEVLERVVMELPAVNFAFIGKSEEIEIYFQKEVFKERIYYLGHRKDLMEVYSTMDMYMNPKRSGGGFSSAMALAAGVPVVTLPDCDVASVAGERFIVENYDDMIDVIHKCVTDRDFYCSQKQWAVKKSEEYTDDKMVEYVRGIIDQIKKQI